MGCAVTLSPRELCCRFLTGYHQMWEREDVALFVKKKSQSYLVTSWDVSHVTAATKLGKR